MSTLPTAPPQPEGRKVGRYEIVRTIGTGGMAVVYLARQLDLDRLVALKELRSEDSDSSTFARRFVREARLAASFSHPNIVTVHDYFQHDDVPYLAMEYLPRGSLRPYIGTVTLEQAGGVLRGLLAGLSHAEERHVVHRDIKPENLLVSNDGSIKITDFGIAKVTQALEGGSLLTAMGMTIGTPRYIAPEQAMGRPVGPWTDLYAAGITAFELMVGHPPFDDTTEPMGIVLRHVNEVPPLISDVVAGVDPGFADWVAWLTSKDPDDRPQSADQAKDELEKRLASALGPLWYTRAALLSAATEKPAQPAPVEPAAGIAPPPVAAVGGTGIHHPLRDGTESLEQAATEDWPDGETVGAAEAIGPPRDSSTPAHRPWSLIRALSLAGVAIAVVLLLIRAYDPSATNGATQEPSSPDADVVPSDVATDPVTTPADTPTSASTGVTEALALQGDQAAGRAESYRQTASRLTSKGRPDVPRMAATVRLLRSTASSYQQAADAAGRGDVAGYGAAVAAAEAKRRQLPDWLDKLVLAPEQSSPTPTHSASSQHPGQGSCAGDSTSDDPSDDACGES